MSSPRERFLESLSATCTQFSGKSMACHMSTFWLGFRVNFMCTEWMTSSVLNFQTQKLIHFCSAPSKHRWCMVPVEASIQTHSAWKITNAQKGSHDIFWKRHRLDRMDTHWIIRENQKMMDSQQPSEFVVVRLKLTTDGLFHTVHSSHSYSMHTSMLSTATLWNPSNMCVSMSTKDLTLLYLAWQWMWLCMMRFGNMKWEDTSAAMKPSGGSWTSQFTSDITLWFISVCTLRMSRECTSLWRMYVSVPKSHKKQL